MALMTFNPPGFVDDLDPAGRQAWHDKISKFMDAARRGRPQIPHSAPRPQFFNPAKTPIGVDAATEDVKWTAFPRIVTLESGSDAQRWKKADSSRDTQDEYCEWSIKRNAANKVVSIAFTCEGPEYWDTLAASRPDKVLELYRQHVDPAVQRADLFDPGGNYIPNNRWNNSVTDGVMHLIQENNTLGAEIEIAGAATIVRLTPAGAIMTDTRELIECGRYGQVERNSDPFIGARVNFHARAKADVTIADPIGIHFAGLDTQGWITPDGADPRSFWRYTRGTNERPVRAVLEVPAGKAYVLEDVRIDGRPIHFAGQVADRIQMTIRALATRLGQSTAAPIQGCVGFGGAAPPAMAVQEDGVVLPSRV